jgi:2-oxoglutarate dehydrogenase E1 component
VIDDEDASGNAEGIERLILCSGKIYVELAGSEAREQDESTAVARVELLYPFPEEEIRSVVEGYPNLREVVWVQEEPKNMGAWFFVEPRLREMFGDELSIRYVGKPARPSPAQGSARFHKLEHAEIVRRAFLGTDGDEDAERTPEQTMEKASASAD